MHPQFWPEDLDYSGKKVVVIGSGATAVTLVPAMAEQAEHVTMLQRPTYIVSRPSEDAFANFTVNIATRLAYGMMLGKCTLGRFFFWLCRTRPEAGEAALLEQLPEQLPPGYDIAKHLTQRDIILGTSGVFIPDGNFFPPFAKERPILPLTILKKFKKMALS